MTSSYSPNPSRAALNFFLLTTHSHKFFSAVLPHTPSLLVNKKIVCHKISHLFILSQPKSTMSDAVTIRTRKVISNPLLARRQFVIDVLHPNRANVSKDELREKLAEIYKAEKDAVSVLDSEPNLVVVNPLVLV